MIEWMLSDVICREFERAVGKHQHGTRKALHVGFRMNVGDGTDQYRTVHMYVFGPCNYVHVAVQEERIDRSGKRRAGKMEHLCYHDSCWRDAVQTFIFKRRDELGGFQSLNRLEDWCDVLELAPEEVEYLHLLEKLKTSYLSTSKERQPMTKDNPFDKRTVWKRT